MHIIEIREDKNLKADVSCFLHVARYSWSNSRHAEQPMLIQLNCRRKHEYDLRLQQQHMLRVPVCGSVVFPNRTGSDLSNQMKEMANHRLNNIYKTLSIFQKLLFWPQNNGFMLLRFLKTIATIYIKQNCEMLQIGATENKWLPLRIISRDPSDHQGQKEKQSRYSYFWWSPNLVFLAAIWREQEFKEDKHHRRGNK